MKTRTYTSPDGSIRLIHGEALTELRELSPAIADMILTDPPYSSGGLFKGDRSADPRRKYVHSGTKRIYQTFTGDNRDQRSYLAWCALWLNECRRISRPGAYCHVFADWRQLPTTTDAIQAGGFVWRGVVAWNKGRGSRAPHKGYHRHQAEYVVWGTNGRCAIAKHDGPFDGVLTFPVIQSEKAHITGKPIRLIKELVRVVPEGSLVADPFIGGGSTAVACALTGRRCIGIEQDRHYFEKSVDQVKATLAGRAAA